MHDRERVLKRGTAIGKSPELQPQRRKLSSQPARAQPKYVPSVAQVVEVGREARNVGRVPVDRAVDREPNRTFGSGAILRAQSNGSKHEGGRKREES